MPVITIDADGVSTISLVKGGPVVVDTYSRAVAFNTKQGFLDLKPLAVVALNNKNGLAMMTGIMETLSQLDSGPVTISVTSENPENGWLRVFADGRLTNVYTEELPSLANLLFL